MRVLVFECDISIGFAQKVPVRLFDFWNIFDKGLYGLQFFGYSIYQERNYWDFFELVIPLNYNSYY